MHKNTFPPLASFVKPARNRVLRVSSGILRKEFPHIQEWCGDHLWAPSCFHGSVGQGWDVVEKYIREQDKYEYNRGEIKKTIAAGLVTFVRGIPE